MTTRSSPVHEAWQLESVKRNVHSCPGRAFDRRRPPWALFSLNTPTPDAAAAIQGLQAASRYDLALGRVGFVGRFGGLYPIYVRGLAYLAARQPAEAAAEFQRILDHRSIVLVDPMDAMARLQLSRALILSGDIEKAKSAYKDLLTLWEHAAPKIPVVEQARAEYARLP